MKSALAAALVLAACSGDGFSSAALTGDSGAPIGQPDSVVTVPPDASPSPDAGPGPDVATADSGAVADTGIASDAQPVVAEAVAPTEDSAPDSEPRAITCDPGSKICPWCADRPSPSADTCCVPEVPGNGCYDRECNPCPEPPEHAVAECAAGQCSFRCVEPYVGDGSGGCELYECAENGYLFCGGECKFCGAELFSSCCTESGNCRSIYLPGATESCASFP